MRRLTCFMLGNAFIYPLAHRRNINIKRNRRLMDRRAGASGTIARARSQSQIGSMHKHGSPSILGVLLRTAALVPMFVGVGPCDRTARGDESAAGPVEVTWMVAVGPDRPMFEKLLRRFHELHPDIRVRPMWVPGSQYHPKLKTLIAAGKPPDLFSSGDVWVAYELPFLADLSDLVQRDAAELELDDFYPELLQACQYSGRQILLPRWFNIALLYYNRTIFDEAHEPYPSPDWTWDDYIDAAKRLTRRHGPRDSDVDVWGSTVTTGWWGEWLIYVRQAGGDLFSDDMNRCLLDSRQAIDGMRFYFDKIYRHGVSPRPGRGPDKGFMSGKIAMEFGGHTGNWITYNQIPGFEWDVQVLPRGPATRSGGEFANDSFGVAKASPHREAAWEFVKFLSSKESVRLHVENGYLPVRKSVTKEMLSRPERKTNPRNSMAAYEQLKYAQQVPRSPDYIEIAMEVIQPDVDRMLDKQLDVADTCRSAAESANRFIRVLGATRREAGTDHASPAPRP
jgi:multiple sugar transport system substrate-binding protein